VTVPVSANTGYVAVTLWQQFGASTMSEITSQDTFAEVTDNTSTSVSFTLQALGTSGSHLFPGFTIATSSAIASVNGCNSFSDPNCATYNPTSDANTYMVFTNGQETGSTIPLVSTSVQ
jgi:hypothetical protein